MQDGKALQSGTSHFLGQNFAKAFDVQFTNREGKLDYVWATSWGVSTRLIGAIIMTHGDERGLRLPPRVAPIQAVILPIAAHKPGVMEACEKLLEELKAADIRVKLDDRDTVSAGYKFNDWEMKGVPLRVEIGPKDIEAGHCVAVRRDNGEKTSVALSEVADRIHELLDEVLDARERHILRLRYGLGGRREKTQKEVADLMGISQSYISRLEKRIMLRLRREISRQIYS